jgi:hypothetical protein
MKRRGLIILLSVTLGCVLLCAALWVWLNYSAQSSERRTQALAQQVADALGRTPADAIVDFRSCGMIDCVYNVYFASPEDPAGMDARVRALSKFNLHVGLADPRASGDPLLNQMNGALGRDRLTTIPSPSGEPDSTYWTLQNERGETVGRVWLYWTRDRGVTYLFDGKPIPKSNIVRLYIQLSPSKE